MYARACGSHVLAEFAIETVKAEAHEPSRFDKQLVDGANFELLWKKAKASYAEGDEAGASFHVGFLLHYVQDMAVPAHAFYVIRQSGPSNWDGCGSSPAAWVRVAGQGLRRLRSARRDCAGVPGRGGMPSTRRSHRRL